MNQKLTLWERRVIPKFLTGCTTLGPVDARGGGGGGGCVVEE